MSKKNNNLDLKVDIKRVDRFSQIVRVFYSFLKIVIIIFAIAILFFSGKTIYNYYHNIQKQFNPDVLEILEEKYNKEFKIVESSTDEDGFGIYSLYCKEDRNVIFNAVKDKETRMIYDDFDYRYRKYYIDNCNDNLKKSLKIKENYTEINGCKILVEYEYWFELSGYHDIEDTTKKVYDIYEYFMDNAKNPYILIVGGIIRQGSYISNVSFEYNKDIEVFLRELQEDYNKYFNRKD